MSSQTPFQVLLLYLTINDLRFTINLHNVTHYNGSFIFI